MDEKASVRDSSLEVNRSQADFYDKKVAGARRLNPAMRAWEWWRNGVYQVWDGIGVFDTVLNLHRAWLGDLSGKRVLDLGCYTGNRLSLELAQASESYLGIDLSESALAKLRARIEAAGVEGAEVEALDFLDKKFDYPPFDVVYANAVLHHFSDFGLLMSLLHERLRPGGMVICFDPMETSTIVRTVRAAYRPFQSNAAWEWPFQRANFDKIQEHFVIEELRGLVGRSKWVIPLSALPVSRRWLVDVGRKLHQQDLAKATGLNSDLWRCMSVTMRLRKR
jgi:2-polyprenyl-3-methyl-5-hydroxy-6-metoxy-1,4-benzoquinol methylase